MCGTAGSRGISLQKRPGQGDWSAQSSAPWEWPNVQGVILRTRANMHRERDKNTTPKVLNSPYLVYKAVLQEFRGSAGMALTGHFVAIIFTDKTTERDKGEEKYTMGCSWEIPSGSLSGGKDQEQQTHSLTANYISKGKRDGNTFPFT